MKQSIIIVTLVIYSFIGFSQSFSGGFMIGAGGSQIDGDEQSGYKKPGFIGGAYISRKLSENISFKIESYYIGKGAVLNIDQADGTVYQQFNTSLHYIEMPFLIAFTLHPKIEIALGIAPSYLFEHKLTQDRFLIDKSMYSLNSLDFQPIGQVDFFLTDKIITSLRFSYSITDVRKEDNMAIWKNNNISIVLRYKIK